MAMDEEEEEAEEDQLLSRPALVQLVLQLEARVRTLERETQTTFMFATRWIFILPLFKRPYFFSEAPVNASRK